MAGLNSLWPLVWLLLQVFSYSGGQGMGQPCNSTVYCYGELLHTIQINHLRKDDKDFVDLALKFDPESVEQNFTDLNIVGDVGGNETALDILETFLGENFVNGSEFNEWIPEDFVDYPDFLNGIVDDGLRTWANKVHHFWHELGREIKEDVRLRSDRYSMYYVSHPTIVPGGRFREFYYWDSYWIQKGLLVSQMTTTVRGMIENFFEMVETLGYIPNGGRIYYQRTQPPLLVPMVKNYYDSTNNATFLEKYLSTMEKEFDFFMNNRTVTFEKNGNTYTMARYYVNLKGPRPESYSKDYELVEALDVDESEKNEIYANLKSGAESGWDFSSRWYVGLEEGQIGNLSQVKTRDIIPVDLNGMLYWNAVILEEFCQIVDSSAHVCRRNYTQVANELKKAIHEVLWDEEQGSWFDYDFVRNDLRKAFYASNIVPLWVKAHHDDSVVAKVVQYFHDSKATIWPAGIPASMIPTGEQWDFPNGWPPLNHIVVEAFENSGNQIAKDLAFEIAQKWTNTNYNAYMKYEAMFEKYDVTCQGCAGGGGEYEVVVGFGWTNGVVLDFLKTYGDRLEADPVRLKTTASSSIPSASLWSIGLAVSLQVLRLFS